MLWYANGGFRQCQNGASCDSQTIALTENLRPWFEYRIHLYEWRRE